MRIQPEQTETHEIRIKQLRAERTSEDRRLDTLKIRLQNEISRQQLSLFAAQNSKSTAA